MIEINEKEFKKKIIETKKTTIVLFYMPYCPYCQRFMPEFEELSNKMKIMMAKVDISDYYNGDLWDEYEIQAVPTIIAFKDRQICTRIDVELGADLDIEDIESEMKNKPECFT